MPDDEPDRFLDDDELRARRDYHVRKLRAIMDEIDRRDAGQEDQPPVPGARKYRHLWSIPSAALFLWHLHNVRDRPVATLAAGLVAAVIATGVALLPQLIGPDPYPHVPGALPARTASPTPTATVTHAPSQTPPPLEFATPAPNGIGSPVPDDDTPGDDPSEPEPTDEPTSDPTPEPPEPSPTPSPPPTPSPTPSPTDEPPDPSPTPTPPPSPSPTPTPPPPPPDREPTLEICLRLPVLLRELCIGLL